MYVYMLRCRDGSLYTGYTPDLQKRFREHMEGRGAKYTKSHPPIEISAAWQTDNKQDALKLEYRIKQLAKAKKEQLISDPDYNMEKGFGISATRI